MRARLMAAAGFLAAAAVVGCSGGEPLYDVSGTVTFDGKPVPKGLIFFDPSGPGGTQGFTSIVDGRYDTADKGKGVRGGGNYVVRINAFDGKEGPDAPLGQALCPEYQETKELPKGKSSADFAIKKKK